MRLTISAPTENERTVTGMAEYIEREALIEWFKCIPLRDLSDGRGLCRIIMEDDFKKAIKKMPKGIVADVAPVRHGRWDENGRCTVCGGHAPFWSMASTYYESPYCFECGAKMDGVHDG